MELGGCDSVKYLSFTEKQQVALLTNQFLTEIISQIVLPCSYSSAVIPCPEPGHSYFSPSHGNGLDI